MKKLIESANNSSDETANSITYESVNGSSDEAANSIFDESVNGSSDESMNGSIANNNRNAKRGMI